MSALEYRDDAGYPEWHAIQPDLASVLTWSSIFLRRPLTLGEVIQLESEDLPADVAGAVRRIRDCTFAHTSDSPTAHDAVKQVLAALDERQRTTLERRLWSDAPDTLDTIAGPWGVTRERVRQIESAAKKKFSQALQGDAGRLAEWFAHRIRQSLGPYLPEDLARAKLSSLGIDLSSEDARVLLHIAGPFRTVDGWMDNLALDGSQRAFDAVNSAIDSGSSVRAEELIKALCDVGVVPEAARAYLSHNTKLHRWPDGTWAKWSGNAVEKAYAALRYVGEPATVAEINNLIAEGHTAGTVQNGMAADTRFMRTGKSKWGLSEWGLEEYTTIFDKMVERIDRSGGRVGIEDLVRDIVDAFPDVSANSVRRYLEAPAFLVESGTVRRRTADDGFTVKEQIRDARGAFRSAESELRLLLPVTFDGLRGSGQLISPAVAAGLGVMPGQERTFSLRGGGTLTIHWRPQANNGPDIGSIKAVLESLDAKIGDSVVLVFDAAGGNLEVRHLNGDLRGAPKLKRILDCFNDASLAEVTAAAVGCPVAEVHSALRQRGDGLLADAVPEL